MSTASASVTKHPYTGRIKLYTGLSKDEVLGSMANELIGEDLEQCVLPVHMYNVAEMNYLHDYYSGYHKDIATRTKETRQEINNKVTINLARAFTRDITSYFLSKPIDYVQRDTDNREQIGKLNHILNAENKELIDDELATDMSIMGVGYRGIFIDSSKRNGSSIKLTHLDPRNTFVVHSANYEDGPLYAVSFYTTPKRANTEEVTTYYTIYTPNKKIRYKSTGVAVVPVGHIIGGLEYIDSSYFSYGGLLPIVEYCNNAIRIGDWESELSIMDAIDKLGSDSINDVEQFVNSILYIGGIELTSESFQMIQEQKVLNAVDIPENIRPEVKYIADQLDAASITDLREYLEGILRSIVGVPDRKERGGGGGDTGDAVYMRDGWQDLDLVASSKEKFFIKADRESIDAILYVLKTHGEITNNLNVEDIEIKFSRNKHSNVQAKAQAYASMVSAKHPIDPFDALAFADLTNDLEDVIMRSDEYAKKQLERQIAIYTAEAEIKANALLANKSSINNSGLNSNPKNPNKSKDLQPDGDE